MSSARTWKCNACKCSNDIINSFPNGADQLALLALICGDPIQLRCQSCDTFDHVFLIGRLKSGSLFSYHDVSQDRPLRFAMKPNEIRACLMLAGVKINAIARRLHMRDSAVHHVINWRRKNQRIRVAIAEAIGQPVDVVFPPDPPKEAA